MGRDTKASDWEYAGVISLSATFALGAGGWAFAFRSKAAGVWEDFVMLALGVGTPSVSVEVGFPDIEADDLSWTKIKCLVPFSAADLDGAKAQFVSGGLSAAMTGYSKLYLSVEKEGKGNFRGGTPVEFLFLAQENAGYASGIDLAPGFSLSAMTGKMWSIGTALRDVIVPVVKGLIIGVGFGTGLIQAGRALLDGRADAMAYAFASGYATGLADCTDPGGWTDVGEVDRLLALAWEPQLRRAVKQYTATAGKGGDTSKDDAIEAGVAAIYQQVYQYSQRNGSKAEGAMEKKHRELYGENISIRKGKYLDKLHAQIKSGQDVTTLGISLDI